MTEKEKIRAEIVRLAQLHLEMLDGYRADGNISAAAIENVLYGHDLSILSFIDSLQEEPASEELQEAIDQSFIYHENRGDDFRIDEQIETAYRYGFESGAKWQEEQFEKNRLAHCDDLTAEQAQIESDFVVQHLKKYNRTPTFIDAIEYGMRLQKAQTMKDAVDGTMGFVSIHLKKPNFGEKFKEGVKVKILVIKED